MRNVMVQVLGRVVAAVHEVAVRPERGDDGQTTAEYALVLLGAVSVALLLIAWVAHSGKVSQLFDTVFDHVISRAR